MKSLRLPILALFVTVFAVAQSLAGSPAVGTDPLAAIDLNRNAIIADIVQGFDGDGAVLAKRLAGLRADRLLSASLASTRESLESILHEAERSRDAPLSRASAKVIGSATSDLVYTPLTPCRMIDTRGFGAPIQGGPFAADERRSYAPNGLCNLPTTGVATILISFTTQNLTPGSGGYLAILSPGSPVTTSVDIFNINSEWSASNTAVATGSAAQFDVFVSTANPQLVVDVLGYFAPPQGTIVKSIVAGTGLTGGTITDAGTIAIAAAYQLPQTCTNGQLPQSIGAGGGWTCVTPPTPTGGTITAVTASDPLASSGGNAPDISLAGVVPVANGGTGQSTLAANGIVYGQGTAAVGTAVGANGQVLAGSAGAPVWTGSPSISGNLVMPASTPIAGNIMKLGTAFIHNFGTGNTFVGASAGNFSMTGAQNTASGANALKGNTSGNSNSASGWQALLSNTTGNGNTAGGAFALQGNTTGFFNTAGGFNALGSNTSGPGNSAYGLQALASNTTGGNNTASGSSALFSNTTGINNVALGANAGINLTVGSFNIDIGNPGVTGETETIRIGDIQTRSFIAGIRDVTTGSPDAIAVFIDSNGQLGTVSSSRRFKDDIADMDVASSALMKLRPVTFVYKTDRGSSVRTRQYGLIAEEVEEVYPGLVTHTADGQAQTVMYQYLPTMLLNEYQKQQRMIEAQAMQVARLESAVAEVADLRRQVAHMVRLLEQTRRFDARTAGLELK